MTSWDDSDPPPFSGRMTSFKGYPQFLNSGAVEMAPPSRAKPKRELPLAVLAIPGIFVILSSAIFLGLPHVPTAFNTVTSLRLGSESPVKESVDLEVVKPIPLVPYTSIEIADARSAIANRHRRLLQSQYSPRKEVFGALADNLPWLSVEASLSPSGQSSRDSEPSYLSSFIMNPYLLVGAHFNFAGALPFQPQPKKLMWDPTDGKAQVRYPLRDLREGLTLLYGEDFNPQTVTVSLTAINARDFGYEYIYFDSAVSSGIEPRDRMIEPAQIQEHFAHLHGACNTPEGCVVIRDEIEELAYMQIRELPARAILKLWKEKPKIPGALADMTFEVVFD